MNFIQYIGAEMICQGVHRYSESTNNPGEKFDTKRGQFRCSNDREAYLTTVTT